MRTVNETNIEVAETEETLKTKEKWKKKILDFVEKIKRFPGFVWRSMWNLGRDDPRRVAHALKVGSALTLVSLLCLLEPLFEGIGENAIWAVMTVVVVLEFTVGATLCKGLNRGIGTLLAGSLAFLIDYIAEETGRLFRALFIGAAVFFIGTTATYMRFFPHVKKNYDYGVVMFLLTFNLITVSSYRVSNVLKIAHERFVTIAIGCGICLIMSLLIFPIWSGEDLHNSIVLKLEGLAKSIQGCVTEYFREDEKEGDPDMKLTEDPIYKNYKAVLDSQSQDETIALHASWEPRHSRNWRYPWQQYVKLGDVLRQFGYIVVALHGCLQTEIQTPKCCRSLFKDPCTRLAVEVSNALNELATSMKNRRHCSPEILSDHLHQALQDLNNALKSQPRLFLGSNKNQDANTLALASQHTSATQNRRYSLSSIKTDNRRYSLSSIKTESSPWRFSRASNDFREGDQKSFRPQMSKFAITSVEFSEALPFAAFASLLVEAVARLDNVIEEAEELGRIACFKEYKPGDDEIV